MTMILIIGTMYSVENFLRWYAIAKISGYINCRFCHFSYFIDISKKNFLSTKLI